MNAADTAWVLVSAALVMFMTPGLALFYGGMIRAKSVLNTMALTAACLGVIAVVWVAFGFSLAFGPDHAGGFIGDFGQPGLYLNPPRNAVVFSVDEKPQIQALQRAAPMLPGVHVICDNLSTHKVPAVRRWLLAHPRFVLHFTPHLLLVDQPGGALVRRDPAPLPRPRRLLLPRRTHHRAAGMDQAPERLCPAGLRVYPQP